MIFSIALMATAILAKPSVPKDDVNIEDVPTAVMAVAKAAQPDLVIEEAGVEERNGITYYDLEGVNSKGEEWELDIAQDGDGWTIVEVQRDVTMADLPDAVKSSLTANVEGFTVARIIESTQTDGRIVYEFFNADSVRKEVLWDGTDAEFLKEEWVH